MINSAKRVEQIEFNIVAVLDGDVEAFQSEANTNSPLTLVRSHRVQTFVDSLLTLTHRVNIALSLWLETMFHP